MTTTDYQIKELVASINFYNERISSDQLKLIICFQSLANVITSHYMTSDKLVKFDIKDNKLTLSINEKTIYTEHLKPR